MDRGDFSAFGIAIANPLMGATAPSGMIPQSQFSPLARNVMAALPAPNLPGISNNYESSPADTIYNDKGDFRYDYFISPKLSAFARVIQPPANLHRLPFKFPQRCNRRNRRSSLRGLSSSCNLFWHSSAL